MTCTARVVRARSLVRSLLLQPTGKDSELNNDLHPPPPARQYAEISGAMCAEAAAGLSGRLRVLIGRLNTGRITTGRLTTGRRYRGREMAGLAAAIS